MGLGKVCHSRGAEVGPEASDLRDLPVTLSNHAGWGGRQVVVQRNVVVALVVHQLNVL